MSGVGVGEVETTTRVINSTRTVWNFQKPAWNFGEMSGNFILGGLVRSLMKGRWWWKLSPFICLF